MTKRILAAVAAALFSLALFATPASANPGPGNSHSCAPGQHGNNDPGWKPPACDK